MVPPTEHSLTGLQEGLLVTGIAALLAAAGLLIHFTMRKLRLYDSRRVAARYQIDIDHLKMKRRAQRRISASLPRQLSAIETMTRRSLVMKQYAGDVDRCNRARQDYKELLKLWLNLPNHYRSLCEDIDSCFDLPTAGLIANSIAELVDELNTLGTDHLVDALARRKLLETLDICQRELHRLKQQLRDNPRAHNYTPIDRRLVRELHRLQCLESELHGEGDPYRDLDSQVTTAHSRRLMSQLQQGIDGLYCALNSIMHVETRRTPLDRRQHRRFKKLCTKMTYTPERSNCDDPTSPTESSGALFDLLAFIVVCYWLPTLWRQLDAGARSRSSTENGRTRQLDART